MTVFSNYKVAILDSSFVRRPLSGECKEGLKNINVYVSNTFNAELNAYKTGFSHPSDRKVYEENVDFMNGYIQVKTLSPDLYEPGGSQDTLGLIKVFNKLNETPIVIAENQFLEEDIKRNNLNAHIYKEPTSQFNFSSTGNYGAQSGPTTSTNNEVQFCMYCGRKLQPGEVCDCQQTKQQSFTQNQNFEFTSNTKPKNSTQKASITAALNEFTHFLFHPVTTARALSQANDHSAGSGMICLKGLWYGVLTLIVSMVSSNTIGALTGTSISFISQLLFSIVVALVVWWIGIFDYLFLTVFSGAKDQTVARNATGCKAAVDIVVFTIFIVISFFSSNIAGLFYACTFLIGLFYQLMAFVGASPQGLEDKYGKAFVIAKVIETIVIIILVMILANFLISALMQSLAPQLNSLITQGAM